MESNILFEIKRIEHLAMQNLMKGKDLGKHPSPTQMRIMQYMMEHKNTDIYQKDLENHLNMSRATISNVLDTMEKNDIIERIYDEVDTRTKKVKITKKIFDLFDETKKEIKTIENKMINNISNEEMEIFKKVLNQMENNLKE